MRQTQLHFRIRKSGPSNAIYSGADPGPRCHIWQHCVLPETSIAIPTTLCVPVTVTQIL